MVTVDEYAGFRIGEDYAVPGFLEQFPVPFFTLLQGFLGPLASATSV